MQERATCELGCTRSERTLTSQKVSFNIHHACLPPLLLLLLLPPSLHSPSLSSSLFLPHLPFLSLFSMLDLFAHSCFPSHHCSLAET